MVEINLLIYSIKNIIIKYLEWSLLNNDFYGYNFNNYYVNT